MPSQEASDIVIMPLDDGSYQLSGPPTAVAAARTRLVACLDAATLAAPASDGGDAAAGWALPVPAAPQPAASAASPPSDHASAPPAAAVQSASPSWPALSGAGGTASGGAAGGACARGARGGGGPSARRACCWGTAGTAGTAGVGASGDAATNGGHGSGLRLDEHVAAAEHAAVELGDDVADDGYYGAEVSGVVDGAYVVSPGAEETLQQLLEEDGEGVMEIDIPREAVGKVPDDDRTSPSLVPAVRSPVLVRDHRLAGDWLTRLRD
jgi:hypothetical protein